MKRARGIGKDGTKENPLEAWYKLKTPDYGTWTIPSYTQFFTTADPVELFQALAESLNALEIVKCQVDAKTLDQNEFRIDAKKLKLKYLCTVFTQ